MSGPHWAVRMVHHRVPAILRTRGVLNLEIFDHDVGALGEYEHVGANQAERVGWGRCSGDGARFCSVAQRAHAVVVPRSRCAVNGCRTVRPAAPDGEVVGERSVEEATEHTVLKLGWLSCGTRGAVGQDHAARAPVCEHSGGVDRCASMYHKGNVRLHLDPGDRVCAWVQAADVDDATTSRAYIRHGGVKRPGAGPTIGSASKRLNVHLYSRYHAKQRHQQREQAYALHRPRGGATTASENK